MPGHPYQRGFDPRLAPHKLADPLRWTRPRRVFVNSMSDLFLEDVPDEYILAVVQVMTAAPWHTYQVLTKRSERMMAMLQGPLRFAAELPQVWWGVSVENRKHGLPRVEHLRQARPHVAFLSIEPLLEDLGEFDLSGIHGVIVGGESGPRARPLEKAWVLNLLRQCRAAGVPFFFKQWGGVRKHATGRELDGHTYDEQPAPTAAPVAYDADRRRAALAAIEELARRFDEDGAVAHSARESLLGERRTPRNKFG